MATSGRSAFMLILSMSLFISPFYDLSHNTFFPRLVR